MVVGLTDLYWLLGLSFTCINLVFNIF